MEPTATTAPTAPAATETWPCDWLVERAFREGLPPMTGEELDEFDGWDGPEYTVVDCGAPCTARADGSGWDCESGHEYTTLEARHAQRWDYAEDAVEAGRLAGAGIEPRDLVTGGDFRF